MGAMASDDLDFSERGLGDDGDKLRVYFKTQLAHHAMIFVIMLSGLLELCSHWFTACLCCASCAAILA